jgi:hypothetical protein
LPLLLIVALLSYYFKFLSVLLISFSSCFFLFLFPNITFIFVSPSHYIFLPNFLFSYLFLSFSIFLSVPLLGSPKLPPTSSFLCPLSFSLTFFYSHCLIVLFHYFYLSKLRLKYVLFYLFLLSFVILSF